MSRLKDLRTYIDKELANITDSDKRTSATAHLYGVSLAMSGMLHDLHAYKSGSYDDHAHLGADLARKVLEELGITSKEETDIICSAIYHHDDKLVTDSPMDELLKDADVIY